MTDPLADAATNRRHFLGLIGLGAAAAAGGGLLAGCSEQAGSRGSATQADQGVLPNFKAMDLVKPDLPGEGPIPDGFLTYPTNLVDAISDKPGTSGQAIKTMAPWWGATPPGLGRNSFLDAVNTELGLQVDPSMQDGNTFADKLSATLGARDVPDLLVAPNWEVDKIPRFSDAVSALFEDLTDYLKGDAVNAYPMLATLPTAAWEYCLWGGRLAAIPFPTDGAYAYMLFQRKDLLDAAGVAAPTTIDELYQFGKRMTNAGKGVWAFGSVFDMVQMFFGAPGSTQNGWRKKAGGGLEHKYETQEYRQALDFTVRLFKDGLIHPDVVATKGADEKTLFNGGKIVMFQDGPGAWQGMQGEQAKVTPGFNMQPVAPFSATGGKPVLWGSEKPVFYTFVKKGLGKDRTEELLRVLNWDAAPFGTKEWELREYGVEGKHFTRGPDGSPLPTELGRKELAAQFTHLGGRRAAKVKSSDTPNYVPDYINYHKATIQYLEPDLFKGIKLELPANYSKVLQPTEDKILDIRYGRRPISDLDAIVREFRSGGGDEGRAFLEKALTDNGR